MKLFVLPEINLTGSVFICSFKLWRVLEYAKFTISFLGAERSENIPDIRTLDRIVAFIISDCLKYVFSPKYLSSYCCCGWEHFGSNTFWFSLQRFHALSCICQGLQGWEGVFQDMASAGQEDLVIFLKWSTRSWTGKTVSVTTAVSLLVSILQEKQYFCLKRWTVQYNLFDNLFSIPIKNLLVA